MIERIPYGGWPEALRLTHGRLELVVPLAVGPRVLRLAFAGGANVFGEVARHLGQSGGTGWRLYGGHRLWHAPEVPARTYAPDNEAVEIDGGDGHDAPLVVRQRPDACGLGKQLELSWIAGHNALRVRHRLTNNGLWEVCLAPWALSVMAPGTQAWIPQEDPTGHAAQKLPTRTMALWGYTSMGDPRWSWGDQLIGLRHDATRDSAQKIGVSARHPWLAGQTPGGLMIVRAATMDPAAEYPDRGVNLEVFVNRDILELETLGPMVTLAPGASVDHDQVWSLHDEILPDSEPARAARLAELAGALGV